MTDTAKRPPVPLGEDARHAISHAELMVSRASPNDPCVCFDYTLVQTLLGLIKSGRAAAGVGPQETAAEQVAQPTLQERLRAHSGTDYMCQDCYGTIQEEAADELDRLNEIIRQRTFLLDQANGTPCQQIRHQQDVDRLTAINAELLAALEKCSWVFNQMANKGNYPEPLFANGGWKFLTDAIAKARGQS